MPLIDNGMFILDNDPWMTKYKRAQMIPSGKSQHPLKNVSINLAWRCSLSSLSTMSTDTISLFLSILHAQQCSGSQLARFLVRSITLECRHKRLTTWLWSGNSTSPWCLKWHLDQNFNFARSSNGSSYAVLSSSELISSPSPSKEEASQSSSVAISELDGRLWGSQMEDCVLRLKMH